MNPYNRLIWMVSIGLVFAICFNIAAFSYPFWGPNFQRAWSDYWKARTLKPAVKAGDRTIAECLGVSDFYSVHLTTYFLADSSESAGGATDDMSRYDEYCDRVPGTGKVIFSLTLMEKEARNEPVTLSFYQQDPAGGLKLINALPPKPRAAGMLSMDATVPHPGKYVLKLGFGEAKTKDDIIEMPITVGR